MERKTIWLVGVVTIFLLFVALGTSLAVVDQTGTVPATATLGASTSLTVQAKRIIDNTNVSSIDFGSLPGGTGDDLAPHYVAVEAHSNYGVWELEIYTNNFAAQPSTTTWGYQYGGMVDTGADGGNRVPMKWGAYISTTTVADPPANLNQWMYLKDKKDINPPGETKMSWAEAHADGYTNIAYGGPDYMNVIQPGGPTGGVPDTDNKLALYVVGQFGPAPADSYSTVIGFDLYHE